MCKVNYRSHENEDEENETKINFKTNKPSFIL